jgi:hypothetical protein
MEENRLKPMVKHDPRVFNNIYKNTEGLRRKLASEIDCRRFGVDYTEVLSWFDVKFIFVFNTYYNEHNEDVLKGHIIKGLQMFKYRILRGAYTVKYSQSIVPLDGFEKDIPDEIENKSYHMDLLYSYLQNIISDNAFILLQTQLNPPPYIIYRLRELGVPSLHKIPDEVLLEYFDLGNCPRAYKYLATLKKEIKQGIAHCKVHFRASQNTQWQ